MPITSIGSNTYRQTFPSGHTVEIGNAGVAQFRPHLKFSKWSGECTLALGFPNIISMSPTVSGDMISAENASFAFEWKPTDIKHQFSDEGGYDWKITLKKKPPTNSFSFTYDKTLVTASHQPPLTAEEVLEGCFRPAHVVNSIAFYHETKRPFHPSLTEAHKYGTCKVGHLYAMLATDAVGKTDWFGWDLPSAGVIKGSLSQTFINTAIYPVVIEPVGDTFGFTTIGGSSLETGYFGGSEETTVGAGTATAISLYATTDLPKGTAVGAAIYSDDHANNKPNVRLAVDSGNVAPPDSPTWVVINISCALAASTSYWLCFASDGDIFYYYDTVSGYTRIYGHHQKDSFETWDDPWGTVSGTTTSRRTSIYVTFTPSGGGSFTQAVGGGALAPAGSPAWLAKVGRGAGTITPSGYANFKAKLPMGSGAVSLAGAIVQKIKLSIGSGSISPAGVVNRIIKLAVGAGALTLAGTLTQKVKVAIGGSLTLAGDVGRKIKLAVGQASMSIAGALTGSLLAAGKFFQSVGEGAVSIAGSVNRKIKLFVGIGSLSPGGSAGRIIKIGVGAASLTIAGGVVAVLIGTIVRRILRLTTLFHRRNLTVKMNDRSLTVQMHNRSLTTIVD